MRTAATVLDITPKKPLPLAGYAGRPNPFERIASALEANLLLIEDDGLCVVLIAIDALFASRALEQLILARLGRHDLILVLVASHTHSAPSLDDRKPLLGIVDEEHLATTAGHIAEAIRSGLTSTVEGPRLHYGLGQAPGSVNRRRRWISISRRFPHLNFGAVMAPNPAVETVAQVQVLLCGTDPAKPDAVIWSWPCHAVAEPDRNAVSADFPGVIRDRLRRHFADPQLPVLYLPGFCGDIRPDIRGARFGLTNILRHAGLPITPFGSTSPAAYEALCEGLASSVIGTVRAARALPEAFGVGYAATSASLRDRIDPPQDVDIGLSRLTIGAAAFLFAGAEVCSPYYELLGMDTSRPIFLSGYAGPVFGYLPSERQRMQGGYEAGGFFPAFGLSGRFRPGVERDFVDAAERLGFRKTAEYAEAFEVPR